MTEVTLLHLQLVPCQNSSGEIRSLKGLMENSDKQSILSWPGLLFLLATVPAPRAQARNEPVLASLEDGTGERAVSFDGRQVKAAAVGSAVRGNISTKEKHPEPTSGCAPLALQPSPALQAALSPRFPLE